MKGFVLLVTLLLLLGIPAGSSLGQQQQNATNQGQQAGQQQNAQQGASGQMGVVVAADKLKDTKVMNRQGKELGKVESFGIDLVSGKISYVTVDTGSRRGLVPVPFHRFGVTQNQQLVLDISEERLAQAPTLGTNKQPNWADQSWAQSVASFWGSPPSGVMVGQVSGTS